MQNLPIALVHFALVACLAAALAVRLVKRPATRALAGAAVFWGFVVIAVAASRGLRQATSLTDFLLFGAHIRGLHDFLDFDLWLLLGYILVASALLAMPWLVPSSMKDLGRELMVRRSNSERRSFLQRREIWMIAALVWVAWRWFSASHS